LSQFRRHFRCSHADHQRPTVHGFRLRDLAAKVTDFRNELAALLELCVFTSPFIGAGLLPPVTVREDVSDDDWVAAKGRVSQAAGRVADLPQGARMMVTVAGFGNVDPFTAWITITQPKPLLMPDDVLAACENAIGRLESMAERAEFEAPVHVNTESMHPLVWGVARARWRSEHYRDAVTAAVGALIDDVRRRTDRPELDEKDVFAQAFSTEPPKVNSPRLRWPGDQQDQMVRSMNRGLLHFSLGVQSAIRNPSVHDRSELTPQEGTERLAAISLLAGWIERCERVDGEGSP
jgi:hypothetical protein